MYTLIESCKLAGADPWVYLSEVLMRLAAKECEHFEALTPENWVEAKGVRIVES